MLRPILYLMYKEFRQIFRDRAMKGIIFVAPIIQLLVLSYAVTTDLKDVRLAIYDQDRTPVSRQLITAFLNSGYFSTIGMIPNPEALTNSLVSGEADISIWIPLNFSENIAAGEKTTIALSIDGSNSSMAGRAAGYAQNVLRQESSRMLQEKLVDYPQLAANIHMIEPVTRFYYNPDLKSQYYMIPGIIALLLTIISAFLTGMAVVKEKEIGTLEQLMVTPITPLQLIIGKTLPFVILAYFELLVASTFAILWFHLPLAGSIPLLALSAFVYLLVTLGIGLFVSTISQTQQQAMFTIWFFLVFGILMSGFFYPIENMPEFVRILTYVNPLRYFMAIIRGIFLRGSTFFDILPNLIPMLMLGIIIFSMAVVRFRKRI